MTLNFYEFIFRRKQKEKKLFDVIGFYACRGGCCSHFLYSVFDIEVHHFWKTFSISRSFEFINLSF